MSFKSMIETDIKSVFLNTEEFGYSGTIVYDGVTYADVPIVITNVKERDRKSVPASDHAQGLFLVSRTLHCAASDLSGTIPEKGGKIRVSDEDGFMQRYYIASSSLEMGMVILELEKIDE